MGDKFSTIKFDLFCFADKESAEEMNNYFRPDALDAGRVEDLVKNYFADTDEVRGNFKTQPLVDRQFRAVVVV